LRTRLEGRGWFAKYVSKAIWCIVAEGIDKVEVLKV
jgi:hypothetical protein